MKEHKSILSNLYASRLKSPGSSVEFDIKEPDTLPSEIQSMIRVDQAGEYGATRIYAGQLAVLGKSAIGPTLREMETQEQEHLRAFNEICVEKNIPPTVFQPLWHIGGYLMGAATALMG